MILKINSTREHTGSLLVYITNEGMKARTAGMQLGLY